MTRAERLFRSLLEARRGVLVGVALVCGVAAFFAAKVRPNYDAEAFLPTWDARRQVFEEHRRSFEDDDRQVLVFVAGTMGPATHAHLRRVAELLGDEGLEDVRWIGNAELAAADPDDPFTLRVEAPFATPDLEAFEARRDDPLLRGRLFSPGADAFVVRAVLPAERDTVEGQLATEAALDAALAPLRAEGVDVRVAGVPILKARGFRLVQGDASRFLALGLALVTLWLFVALRRLRDVAAIVLSLLPAILVTLGVMGATDTPISALTSFIPLLVWIVGVCDALHLVTEVRAKRAEGLSSRGDRRSRIGAPSHPLHSHGFDPCKGGTLSRRDAIARAFAELWRSCLFTSLTTALGFGSLALSGVAIVVELALFTALAIVLAFVCAMVVLPLLLDLGAERAVRETAWLERLVAVLVDRARAHARRPSVVGLVAAVLFSIAALTGATRLRTNASLVDDVRPDHPLMRDLRWIEDVGLAPFSIALWLRADDPETLTAPETYAWMTRTSVFLRGGEPVRGVVGPTEYFESAARALDLPPPSRREEVAQLGLLLDMAAPDGFDDVWRPAEGQARLVADAVDLGSARMDPYFAALEAHLAEDPPPPGVRVDVTGTLRLSHVALADILSGFGTSLVLAFFAVFALLSWLLRSVWQGLLAMVPNLLPLLAMLGAMGALGLDVKPSTLLVFSVALGIAVDDTLHLVGRLVERRRLGDAMDAAIDDALRTSGRAIVLTSLVIGAGFAVLVTSDFRFLVLVGAMTALAVVTALVADLFVYPVLLRRGAPAPALVGQVQA
ncbi:MAG: MMPL family transporter [Sandaracinus sp.]|nr:MMPL family transporter [Sandaracinus sp.]